MVEIVTTGFRRGVGFDIYFGSAEAPNVVIEGETRLVATSPPAPGPGLVDVRMRTTQGDVIVLRNAFRYVAP